MSPIASISSGQGSNLASRSASKNSTPPTYWYDPAGQLAVDRSGVAEHKNRPVTFSSSRELVQRRKEASNLIALAGSDAAEGDPSTWGNLCDKRIGQLDNSCACDVRHHNIEFAVNLLEWRVESLNAIGEPVDRCVPRHRRNGICHEVDSECAVGTQFESAKAKYATTAANVEYSLAAADPTDELIDDEASRWMVSVAEPSWTELYTSRRTGPVVRRPRWDNCDAATKGQWSCVLQPPPHSRAGPRPRCRKNSIGAK